MINTVSEQDVTNSVSRKKKISKSKFHNNLKDFLNLVVTGVEGSDSRLFYQSEEMYIQFFSDVIYIRSDSRRIQEIITYLEKNICEDRNILVSVNNIENKNTYLLPYGEKAKKLFELAKKLDSMNFAEDFPPRSPYFESISFDFNNMALTIGKFDKIFFELTSDEEIEKFNLHHNEILEDIKFIENSILDTLHKWDKNASINQQDNSVQIFDESFPLLFRRNEANWNVYFYKFYRPEDVLSVKSIRLSLEPLLKRAEEFGKALSLRATLTKEVVQSES